LFQNEFGTAIFLKKDQLTEPHYCARNAFGLVTVDFTSLASVFHGLRRSFNIKLYMETL